MQCLTVVSETALGTTHEIEELVAAMHAERKTAKKAEEASVANPFAAALATLRNHDAARTITRKIKQRRHEEERDPILASTKRREAMIEAAIAGKKPLKKHGGDDDPDDASTRLPTEGAKSRASSDDESSEHSSIGDWFL